MPEIFWKLNGSRINDSGDFFLLQNFNRTLRLGSLHPERHDGLYACEAVGNFTRTRATFEIKVLGTFPILNYILLLICFLL